jgi:hypothetical protein
MPWSGETVGAWQRAVRDFGTQRATGLQDTATNKVQKSIDDGAGFGHKDLGAGILSPLFGLGPDSGFPIKPTQVCQVLHCRRVLRCQPTSVAWPWAGQWCFVTVISSNMFVAMVPWAMHNANADILAWWVCPPHDA